MKTYTRTEQIQAEPMTLGEWGVRVWGRIGIMADNEPGFQVVDDAEERWMSEKDFWDEFEEAK